MDFVDWKGRNVSGDVIKEVSYTNSEGVEIIAPSIVAGNNEALQELLDEFSTYNLTKDMLNIHSYNVVD